MCFCAELLDRVNGLARRRLRSSIRSVAVGSAASHGQPAVSPQPQEGGVFHLSNYRRNIWLIFYFGSPPFPDPEIRVGAPLCIVTLTQRMLKKIARLCL